MMLRSAVAALLMLGTPALLHAQYSRAPLTLAVHAHGVHLRDDAPAARGGSLGISLGHGIGEHVVAFFAVDAGAIHDVLGWTIASHADLGLRVYPLQPARIAPFAVVAFTGHGRDRSDVLNAGTGFTAGGGAELRTSGRLGFMLSAARTWGAYDDGGASVEITRVSVSAVLR